MTVQEQQMIDDLVDRIRNTNLTDKDPDAEQRLQQGLASYPDAIYVLAQTVLVQKYGLEQAQQKMQAMQAELDQLHQQPKPHGSFLGNLLGLNDQPPPQPQYAQPYPPQAYPPPAYAPPVYAAPQSGGFLRSAMQTAAGVAMGEIAFQGMESLFHGFGGSGGYGYGGPKRSSTTTTTATATSTSTTTSTPAMQAFTTPPTTPAATPQQTPRRTTLQPPTTTRASRPMAVPATASPPATTSALATTPAQATAASNRRLQVCSGRDFK